MQEKPWKLLTLHLSSVREAPNMYLNFSCTKIPTKARQKQMGPIWMLRDHLQEDIGVTSINWSKIF